MKGFPWHPHRGIETITYVLTGDIEHGDSLGNKGIITSGDMQWMTKPVREPIAWYGPIVMNTYDELKTAFEEYEQGTFIKYRPQDRS